MSNIDAIIRLCSQIFTGIAEFSVTAAAFLPTLLDFNYNMMSVLLQVGSNFFNAVWAAIKFIYSGLYAILVCLIEFLNELENFVSVFLHLLWKICVLVLSFLNLVFHSVKSVAYFLWTGGKWTAETIIVSGRNLTDNGLGTWRYFVVSFKEFTSFVVGGLGTLGECARSVAEFGFDVLGVCYDYVHEFVLYTDFCVRYVCRYILESVYYFFTEYFINLPKEAYLGFLFCFASSMILKNVIDHLCSEGLTFPISSWFGARFREDNDSDFEDYENERGEFSDDDDILNYTFSDVGNAYDNNDEISVSSDDSESSNDDNSHSDEELEIDSESDNESNATGEGDLSDINIQLPDVNNGCSRRSATPSRITRDMSPDDLQKVIESEKEKRMCVVCQDRSKSVLILPCRHMCLCLECGNHIARSRAREQKKCPLCRTRITTIMNVYL